MLQFLLLILAFLGGAWSCNLLYAIRMNWLVIDDLKTALKGKEHLDGYEQSHFKARLKVRKALADNQLLTSLLFIVAPITIWLWYLVL